MNMSIKERLARYIPSSDLRATAKKKVLRAIIHTSDNAAPIASKLAHKTLDIVEDGALLAHTAVCKTTKKVCHPVKAVKATSSSLLTVKDSIKNSLDNERAEIRREHVQRQIDNINTEIGKIRAD